MFQEFKGFHPATNRQNPFQNGETDGKELRKKKVLIGNFPYNDHSAFPPVLTKITPTIKNPHVLDLKKNLRVIHLKN